MLSKYHWFTRWGEMHSSQNMQPLLLFAVPVLLALFLQAMYGAVDLLIVGKFASSADVSAVSTGSQIMTTLTNLVSSFAMGTTILLGQQIGNGKKEEGGHTVGFVMIQGILGAFCVRVPVSYIMSIQPNTSLFHIGLATPMSSILQLILCVGFMLWLQKNRLLDDNLKKLLIPCSHTHKKHPDGCFS